MQKPKLNIRPKPKPMLLPYQILKENVDRYLHIPIFHRNQRSPGQIPEHVEGKQRRPGEAGISSNGSVRDLDQVRK